MAKYIEIINNDNIVSVDDTQPRLSLMRSVNLNEIGYDYLGDYTWGAWMGDYGQYCITRFARFPIQLGANEKMFSIRALQDNPHMGFSRLASNNSLSYLYAYLNTHNTIGYTNYVVDFYGYDSAKTGVLGVQVFDPNDQEKVIFNSNKYYFDVKGQYNVQHADGFVHEFVNEQNVLPRNINIGGYSRSNTAVVINNGSYQWCHFRFPANYMPSDLVYTVVFGSTIYLEPRVAFWTDDWSTIHNPSNHIAYPNYARLSSGVFLDTTNIS